MQIVAEVETGKVHGCKLIDLVGEHSNSGIPTVRAVAERLLGRLGIVLYSQVCVGVEHVLLTSRTVATVFASPLRRHCVCPDYDVMT